MKKPKLYKCTHPGCKWEGAILSKKLCPMHRSLELGKDKQPKKNYCIPKQTEKNKVKRKKERECLNNFFKTKLDELKKYPFSRENNERIYEPSKLNLCHLMPKRTYRSIQCHEDNCVFLSWLQHSRFDKLLDERRFEDLEKEFPNTWEYVKDKYRVLLPLTIERGKLKEALKIYLKI